jgi:hypothetical protein
MSVARQGYPPLTSTATRIEPPVIWTGVARTPGLSFVIEHIIEPTGFGTSITERAAVSGPLHAVAAPPMGKRLGSRP